MNLFICCQSCMTLFMITVVQEDPGTVPFIQIPHNCPWCGVWFDEEEREMARIIIEDSLEEVRQLEEESEEDPEC